MIGCLESLREHKHGIRRIRLSISRQIYTENCRGCHGTKDEPSGAITLDNPTYIAVIPRDTLRSIIAGGVTGTAMVAFSEEHGGMLTEKQIDILVEGITASGAKNPPPGPLPAYSAPLGDVAVGEAAFAPSAQVAMAQTGPAAKPARSFTLPTRSG